MSAPIEVRLYVEHPDKQVGDFGWTITMQCPDWEVVKRIEKALDVAKQAFKTAITDN